MRTSYYRGMLVFTVGGLATSHEAHSFAYQSHDWVAVVVVKTSKDSFVTIDIACPPSQRLTYSALNRLDSDLVVRTIGTTGR